MECLHCVALPSLGESHMPASYGWRGDLPCTEVPGSAKEVKEKTLYVSRRGKERALNIGRPPK